MESATQPTESFKIEASEVTGKIAQSMGISTERFEQLRPIVSSELAKKVSKDLTTPGDSLYPVSQLLKNLSASAQSHAELMWIGFATGHALAGASDPMSILSRIVASRGK